MFKTISTIIVFCIASFTVVPAYAQDDEETMGTDSITHSVGKIQIMQIPDSVIENLRKDDDYWYVNVAPVKKQKKVQNTSAPDSKGLRQLIWVLILVAFIAVIIAYLRYSNVRLFRRTATNLAEEESDGIMEDIYTLNYEKEIRESVERKDYRMAVRLLYLKTLKTLSEKGIIDFKSQKPNSDYLFQLHNTSYYKDFSRLTRNFEYTWYGGFPLSPEIYSSMSSDFAHFQNVLR